jgi:hypothetical protein
LPTFLWQADGNCMILVMKLNMKCKYYYLGIVTKVKLISFSQLAKDLLHPSPAEEKRKHKLKRLVQHPNSYFMDVKCPGKPHIDLQQ